MDGEAEELALAEWLAVDCLLLHSASEAATVHMKAARQFSIDKC